MLTRKTLEYMGKASKAAHEDGIVVNSWITSHMESINDVVAEFERDYADLIDYLDRAYNQRVATDQGVADVFSDPTLALDIKGKLEDIHQRLIQADAIATKVLGKL